MSTASLRVLLLDGESEQAIGIGRCLAQAPEVELHVLSRDPHPPLRYSRRRASFQTHDVPINDLTVDMVRGAVRRSGAQILFPVLEPAIRFCVAHRAELEICVRLPPLPCVSALDRIGDKWALATFLQANQIPHPPTLLLANPHRPDALNGIRFPALVKPIHGSGGQNIKRFEGAPALSEWLRNGAGAPAEAIVQSIVQGRDLGCSVLCQNGRILAYTIQETRIYSARPFAPPAGIRFLEDERILSVIRRLAHILNWSGVANFDFREDAGTGEIFLLDFNPRYWSSLLGSLAAGVNFPLLACLAAADAPIPQPRCAPTEFVCAHFHPAYLASRRTPGATLQNTIWRYTLADPLPRVAAHLHRGWRRLRSRPPIAR
ncbi:hypothetical protein CCAX7_32140 [Capsulimonas corticalis]|uniref:Uncharacterized protein n=1 Tax=Capsulimonas corticalis TaxID=2219043 RepID=A0A402D4A2_9BACT|nr:ATP-grasp domain-containing protein [Capsulimonas corticalis]BDI31163.1 hypothetical protein CCAX7_32140 [Capsulimonas corticalis]